MHKSRITEFLDDANAPEVAATFERFEHDAHAGLRGDGRDKGAGEGGIAIIEQFVYDPYGQLPPFDAEVGASRKDSDWKYVFQGECYDEHADLYEFRERAFDPAPGRWIEQEPAGYMD